MATEITTWFGGYRGRMWNADRNLHLLRDDDVTFCNIATGLRYPTRRELTGQSSAGWCHTCHARCQEVRRDVA